MEAIKLFPEKQDVLTAEFAHFNNFFPIALIEFKYEGESIRLPVLFTFFDADSGDEEYFAKGENGGNFSFLLIENACKPTFKDRALQIHEDYQEFLDETLEIYNSSKSKGFAAIQFPPKPDWWQNDDTPKNESGEKMIFICQIDMDEIVDDDCRLFVFYDPKRQIIKNIYQRD